MELLSIITIILIIYAIVYVVLLCFIDADLELAWATILGKSIDTMQGKVVWITGASSGIGEHLAYTLAKSGVKLVLSARRSEELGRVKSNCLLTNINLDENDIFVLPLDVMQYEKHQQCLDSIIQHFGQLDILVNNAGRSQRAVWEDIELGVHRNMFELNVFSVIELTRVCLKYFLSKGGGHVAATSSIAGIFPAPFSASYTGSKFALQGYLNSLRFEKGHNNIRVTTFLPGPTYTNFLSEAMTSVEGEKYGIPATPQDKRMSSERCGHLFATALANELPESWAGIFPIIPLAYVHVYFPLISRIFLKYLGPKLILKLRDTQPNESLNV